VPDRGHRNSHYSRVLAVAGHMNNHFFIDTEAVAVWNFSGVGLHPHFDQVVTHFYKMVNFLGWSRFHKRIIFYLDINK